MPIPEPPTPTRATPDFSASKADQRPDRGDGLSFDEALQVVRAGTVFMTHHRRFRPESTTSDPRLVQALPPTRFPSPGRRRWHLGAENHEGGTAHHRRWR
jgi:hypothetical protein